MIPALEWLAGAVAIVGVLCRIRLWRGRPLQPGARHLVGFTVTIGLSLVLLPLSQSPDIPGRETLGTLVPLLCAELRLAAECFLVLLVFAVRPGRRTRSWARWQAAGSALVMTASAALYRAAGVTAEGAMLAVEERGRAELTGYNMLFTAHSLWCVGLFTLVMHRSARSLGPGLLRTGLRLVAASGACGLLWSALSVIPLVSGFRTGRQDRGLCSASAALATLVLIIGGMTLTAWGDRMAEPVRRLRARRDHRRIGPLWSALYAVRPEIALEPPGARNRHDGLSTDPEFALYRRVIEIRDGQLALRVHLHPAVPEWAAAACRAARLDPRRTAATVEAAVLAAALEAAAAGLRYPYPTTGGHTPPATPPDLRTETTRLALVAEAFTDSPLVADIRRRVRKEMVVGATG
ncbi:MAB_1171c family putative transporter [Kitasatospora sp. NPDC048540]|uniref:MAB_1171c family putative transporter n=1 Tax=Kitasatospora sp. NPDC048540 TaxID=3155634 RepID=UPI003410B31F